MKKDIHERNKTNDLTGAEWKYSTMSVIDKIYPINMHHKLRNEHGGQKPPQLCADIISYFTKENQTILDPFAGVGGSLLGASLIKRNAIGIEINKKWKEVYEKVSHLEGLPLQKMIVGNSNLEIEKLTNEFDMILTDVPYWNMDKKKSNRNTNGSRKVKLNKFNENKEQTLEEWLELMKSILSKAVKLLKNKGYMAIFIGDMYSDKNFYHLSGLLSQKILEIKNIRLKSDIIWVDKSKSLHIFGYPYSYVPSIIHQHILIFKKEDF